MKYELAAVVVLLYNAIHRIHHQEKKPERAKQERNVE